MATHTMYQVHVTTRSGDDLIVGPCVNMRGVLEPLVETINRAVATGKERDWRDARIEKIEKLIN